MKRMISDTELYKQLKEQETENGTSSIISATIAERLQPMVESLSAEIPVYMANYTLHNMDHVVNVLDIIYDILPNEVRLNIPELTILIYSVALHDIGMLINKDDAEQLKNSEAYRRVLAEFDKSTSDEEVLSELIRRTHVERSCQYVDKFKENETVYHLDFQINNVDFSAQVKNVIRAHGLDIVQLTEKDYPINKLIGNERVNVKFLALLLRLGDILDFDNTRTPLYLLEHRKITNEKSALEWDKHLSITGKEITNTQIEFQAECHSAEVHRCVLSFFRDIENGRKETMECIRKMENTNRYLTLYDEIKYSVDEDGTYIYEDLEIQFNYEKVLSLLMGTALYSSPDVFLRELLQNAYDACFVREAFEKRDEGEPYRPVVKIHYDSKTNILSVEDNGMGMDMTSVRNYVTKIGSSYYQSKEFQSELVDYTPISNFGIGILSCFMVSDEINIESLRYSTELAEREPINVTLNLKSSFIERKISSRKKFGTKSL